MYVIDQNNKIIFHPDTKRIGETVRNNTGLKYMQATKNGNIRLINSRGVDNLAGFSYIPQPSGLLSLSSPLMSYLSRHRLLFIKLQAEFSCFICLFFILSGDLHSLFPIRYIT